MFRATFAGLRKRLPKQEASAQATTPTDAPDSVPASAAGVPAATLAEVSAGAGALADPRSAALDDRFAAAVATGLWRMRNRMVEPGTDRPLPDLRQLYRHLESTWDALASAGIEIQSHDGDLADPGLSLSVVAYQPTPGIDRERIVETIRPTVYLGGRIIQQGEVIVGTPADDSVSTGAVHGEDAKQ